MNVWEASYPSPRPLKCLSSTKVDAHSVLNFLNRMNVEIDCEAVRRVTGENG